MSRARDLANLGDQAGSGFDASDLTTGTLGNTVQDNITRLGTVTTGTLSHGTTLQGYVDSSNTGVTFPAGTIIQVQQQIRTIDNSGADINNPSFTATAFSSGFKAHEFSFTPHKSNSKLLLNYTGQVKTLAATSGAEMYFSRDNTNSGTDNGTKIRTGSAGNKTANQFNYNAASGAFYHAVATSQMVDASQNTAIRFLVIFTSYDGDIVTIQHDGLSVLTIMEIAQ